MGVAYIGLGQKFDEMQGLINSSDVIVMFLRAQCYDNVTN